MKFKGLDNREYTIDANRYKSQSDDLNKSSLHLRTRDLLKTVYPYDMLLEELPLPSTRLFADFFVPMKRVMVEVQGEQHYRFNPFFHKDATTFADSLSRDKLKAQWCLVNNIVLIELPYNESDDEWRIRITS